MCVCERERYVHTNRQKESHSNSAEGRDPFHTTIGKWPEREIERERESELNRKRQTGRKRERLRVRKGERERNPLIAP